MSRDRVQEDLSAMAFTGMLLVAVLLLAAAAAPAGASESFLASVVSFAPVGDPRDGAPENLQKNLVDIQSLLSSAQLGTCDLVVLPELVFYYAGIERALAEGKAALREYAVPLPPVGSNPCAFKPSTEPARSLPSTGSGTLSGSLRSSTSRASARGGPPASRRTSASPSASSCALILSSRTQFRFFWTRV